MHHLFIGSAHYFNKNNTLIRQIQLLIKYNVLSSVLHLFLICCISRYSNYTPPRCFLSKCAILFATNLNETSFVIDHINRMNLFVQVLWMKELDLLKVVNQLETNQNASFLLLSSVPSLVVPHLDKYNSIIIDDKDIASDYEAMKIVKLMGHHSKGPIHLKRILESITLNESVVENLLHQVRLSNESNIVERYNQVACDNVDQIIRANNEDHQFEVSIVGLFPEEESSVLNQGRF